MAPSVKEKAVMTVGRLASTYIHAEIPVFSEPGAGRASCWLPPRTLVLVISVAQTHPNSFDALVLCEGRTGWVRLWELSDVD